MRIVQSIALALSAGISSASTGLQGSGVPTLSPTFRPTADAALGRLSSSAPPTPSSSAPPTPADDGYPAGVSDAPTRMPSAGAGSVMTVGVPSLSPTRSPVDVSRRLLAAGTPAPTADGTPAPTADGTPAPTADGTPTPTADGTPAPFANGGRRRLSESIPPTLSPTFSPLSGAGRRLQDSSDGGESSDDSSDESSDEFIKNDCTTGVEMKNRWNVPWCWKVKNEFGCERSYATVPKDRSIGKERKPGLAYLTGCRWFSNKVTFDGQTGSNVCVPDMSCIMEKSWNELVHEWVPMPPKAFLPRFRANHKNNTSTVTDPNAEPVVLWVNDFDNTANGNSGSDSPPEVEPTDEPNSVTEAPTLLPSAMPTSLPTLIPTLCPSAVPSYSPSAVPSYSPTSVPTPSPTTVAPTAAPTRKPIMTPPPRRVASPRCGKLKLKNKKEASTKKVAAADAMECRRECSECPKCNAFVGWSFKSGSKSSCTCYGEDSKLKFTETGAFFGAVELDTVPMCGSLKAGKKGKSVPIGKVISPRVCQWRCGGRDGVETSYEQFNFKFDKDGKMGDCNCVSGKAKRKLTQTFGSTN